ncbi:hypothetical protein BC938DRAFT_474543, partial [Jimgerdemannia flammicorona]
ANLKSTKAQGNFYATIALPPSFAHPAPPNLQTMHIITEDSITEAQSPQESHPALPLRSHPGLFMCDRNVQNPYVPSDGPESSRASKKALRDITDIRRHDSSIANEPTNSQSAPVWQETCSWDECGATFTRSENLDTHIRSWHLAEEYRPSLSSALEHRTQIQHARTRDEPNTYSTGILRIRRDSSDVRDTRGIMEYRAAKTRDETDLSSSSFPRNSDDRHLSPEEIVRCTLEAQNCRHSGASDHDINPTARITVDDKPHSTGTDSMYRYRVACDRKSCYEVFKSSQDLTRHIRMIHTNDRSCTVCFNKSGDSVLHANNHEGQSHDGCDQRKPHMGTESPNQHRSDLTIDIAALKLVVENLQRNVANQDSRIQFLEVESKAYRQADDDKSAALEAAEEAARRDTVRIEELLADNVEKDAVIIGLQKALAIRDANIHRLEEAVSTKTVETEELKKAITLKDAEIIGLKKAVDAEAVESESMVMDLEQARAEVTMLQNAVIEWSDQCAAKNRQHESLRDFADKEADKLKHIIASKDAEIEKLRGTVVVIDRSLSNESKTISLGELAKQNAALVNNSKQQKAIKIKIPISRKPRDPSAVHTSYVDDHFKVARIQSQDAGRASSIVGQPPLTMIQKKCLMLA